MCPIPTKVQLQDERPAGQEMAALPHATQLCAWCQDRQQHWMPVGEHKVFSIEWGHAAKTRMALERLPQPLALHKGSPSRVRHFTIKYSHL